MGSEWENVHSIFEMKCFFVRMLFLNLTFRYIISKIKTDNDLNQVIDIKSSSSRILLTFKKRSILKTLTKYDSIHVLFLINNKNVENLKLIKYIRFRFRLIIRLKKC